MAVIKESVRRGDIYLVNLDPIIGAEIGKERPALIIQNDIGNAYSPVTIVAPIHSVKEIVKDSPVMVLIKSSESQLRLDSYVDCGQIRTVDKHKRLIKKIGNLSESQMHLVDKALRISLSLR